jgi:hypothetical protein
MEPVLYFYSIDGTATCGPVTEDALRLLFKDKVIGPGSFLCPLGESEWKPLDVAWLRRPPPQTLRLPRYEPPPYVPTDTAKLREEERVQQLEEVWDEGPYPGVFRWSGVAFASLATLILAAEQVGTQNIVAGLLAGVVFTALIPYLLALAFRQPWRLRVWAIAIVIFTGLTFAGQALYNNQPAPMADATPTPDTAPAKAATVPLAEARMEKAKELANENANDVARMVKDAQPVQQEMIDKVKATDAAEKACGNFDPASLTTQADLKTLRAGIDRLRAAQADVLAYFQTYDDRCRTALANGGFSADGIERFVAGAHETGHIDQAVAIWQLRIKLTDDHLARLDFLDKHWGTWQPKDGKLLFTNQDDLDTYNALTQNLVADISHGNDLQSQAMAK